MSYDIVIIGSGPGGYTAAVRAAQLGKRVAIIEKESIGGTCLNRGCIPAKALITAVDVYNTVLTADKFGVKTGTGSATLDWQAVQKRKSSIVSQLQGGLKTIFQSYGIEVIPGTATFSSPKEVVVASGNAKTTIRGEHFIIASGTVPAEIKGLEVDHQSVVDSTDALNFPEIPQRLMIIGGGVIGVELGCMYSRAGSDVTIVELLPQILPNEDTEIAAAMTQILKQEKVVVMTNTKVEKLIKTAGCVEVYISNKAECFKVDKVLVSIGRQPVTSLLGLDKIMVKTEKGFVVTNTRMQTSIPNIYAVGDVVYKGIQLAYVAAQQGIIAAENICGKHAEIDYKTVPSCIYTHPEIASAGYTEKQANDNGISIMVGKFPFAANGRSIILGDPRGFVKTVIDKTTGEVIGMHIIGNHATELISTAVMGMHLEVLPEDFKRIMFGHPTVSEALMEAIHDAEHEAVDKPKGM
ncbi:MAG: dihydrolipoyl dehydrogenase [Elusimicrobiota bacterium]